MPRRPDTPCAECGKLLWPTNKTRAKSAGQVCHECRRSIIKHGTVHGYDRKGCRCDDCRAARAKQYRDYSKGFRERNGYGPWQKYRTSEAVPISRSVRMKIYERDGWVCQLCNEPVDKHLHWNDRMAPTLDHIECQSWVLVPDHSESNLRLVHRSCNSIRGARS